MTIIKKFDTELPNRTFSKKYIALVVVGLFMLILVEIWVSNNVATYGERMDKLSNISKSLTLENQTLENEIAKNESLKNMATQSSQLGFSEPENIQYIR